MKSISLELQEELLKTIERCARALGIPRAEYIRREIERINRVAPICAELSYDRDFDY